MNNYNCEIVADSLNTFGNRITTFKLTYPRIVHSEFMTHRMFSRNAASSRAVPVKKMIESVKDNMFTPLAIQKAHKGMQGLDYFKEEKLEQAKELWVESAELALQQAEKMEKFGITKQLINRMLEPYQYYQVLVTSTEWENFFKLRCPSYSWQGEGNFRSWKDLVAAHFKSGASRDWVDELENTDTITRLQNNTSQAEIHIQALAEAMWDVYNESEPKELKAGDWHIPFGDNIVESDLKLPEEAYHHEEILEEFITYYKAKIAIARCARISYQTLGDNPTIDYEKDLSLFEKLKESEHWSPFEHVAKAMNDEEYEHDFHFGRCRNFTGFVQYRTFCEYVL